MRKQHFENGVRKAWSFLNGLGLFESKSVFKKGHYEVFERNSKYGHDFVIHKNGFVAEGSGHYSSLQEAKKWIEGRI